MITSGETWQLRWWRQVKVGSGGQMDEHWPVKVKPVGTGAEGVDGVGVEFRAEGGIS